MKPILAIFALLLCLSSQAQQIQLSGKLIGFDSESVSIKIFSDGVKIDELKTTDPFYAVVIGSHPHYTILFESGQKKKYCHIIMINMVYETINLDIDFRSRVDAIIVKRKRQVGQYNVITYTHQGNWDEFNYRNE
jgi:hypothetical protein